MIPLYNHDSMDNAFLVSDYPYGNKRCRIRYWLENHPKKGFRFCSQTEHPVKLIWNAPKKSTYCLLGGCMFLDEQNHCTWSGLTEYSSAEEVLQFIQKFPGSDLSRLEMWCKTKVVYLQARLDGKAKWTINKVVQEDSEAELQRMRDEMEQWKKCSEKLNSL